MSTRDPRLRYVKIYWAGRRDDAKRQYAYFRPTHTRIHALPWTPEFFAEIQHHNDNFEASRRRPAVSNPGKSRPRPSKHLDRKSDEAKR